MYALNKRDVCLMSVAGTETTKVSGIQWKCNCKFATEKCHHACGDVVGYRRFGEPCCLLFKEVYTFWYSASMRTATVPSDVIKIKNRNNKMATLRRLSVC